MNAGWPHARGPHGYPGGLLATLLIVGIAAGCGGGLGSIDRIVLVTLDTTRADRLGCYGYEDAVTPVLDTLAAESVLFENAVSPVPTTLPSHATMMTGLYPQDHGVRYNIMYRLGDDAETLAERLGAAGFATAAFPATQIVAAKFGLDQGFEHWVEPPEPDSGPGAGHPLSQMRTAGEGVDLALEWLDTVERGRSFFWLHFYDPHWPYTPPFPYADQYRDRPYDGEIAYVDAQLGRLLDRLRNDPEWSRTLVIVVGDHGEGLYEHGERYHSTLIYESTQHVPLLIRAPGATIGRIAEPVTLADLAPTVLDLAGLELPTTLRGVSLQPALRGREPERRDLYFETLAGAINYGWAELRGLRYGEWKLIDSNEPELFNLEIDPGEEQDLAPVEFETLDEMRSALGDVAPPLATADGTGGAALELDQETLAQLSSLGYVAGETTGELRADAPHPRNFVDLEPELLAGQGALANKQFDSVRDVCEYVLGRDPTNRWALNSKAQAMLGLDRPEEALDAAQRLLELTPEGERAFALVATAYNEMGRLDDARATLARGREVLPGSEQLSFLSAVAAFDAGDPDVCGEALERQFAEFSDSSRMVVLRSRCRAREGKLPESLAALSEAVELGFRMLDVIEQEPDFSSVVATEEYRELADSVRESGNEDAPLTGSAPSIP